MREIKIFMKEEVLDGFTVQPGFVGIMDGSKLVAVTSGWEHKGDLFIYKKIADQWVGRWEKDYEKEKNI